MLEALEAAEPGVHVGSGGFRVDRERALRTLMSYQLPDARAFLLPWLRLAAASGATRVAVAPLWRGLELRFDGEPLSAERLKDPFACLFSSEREPRYIHLVAGLLAVLKLEPSRIAIASGRERRFQLEIEGLKRESLTEDRGGEETTLRVHWAGWLSLGKTRECLERALLACGLYPAGLIIAGRLPLRPVELSYPLAFDAHGVRGRLGLLAAGAIESGIAVYKLGVRVTELRRALSGRQVRAHVNDDALELTASQSGVLADDRLARLLAVVETQAQALR
ncbi:MAG: hypothetical protein HY554_17555 [Elusimicrobia bacterium]|nr:hypothetical protein [Elusimicrobiota bacterium]